MKREKLTEELIHDSLESLSEYIVSQFNHGFDFGKQVSIIYNKDKEKIATISVDFEFYDN